MLRVTHMSLLISTSAPRKYPGSMECDMNVIKCGKNFDLAKYNVYIKG